MNIALIGYGKMGKTIERLAQAAGHHIVLKITRDNANMLTRESLRQAQVAIEFTSPEAAGDNVRICLDAGIPVVSGSTGWQEQIPQMRDYCMEIGGTFLHASNFSIGVNIFFEVNKLLARLMAGQPGYDVAMEETHHTEKKDAPSGTAVSLASQILAAVPRKLRWTLAGDQDAASDLSITARREPGVPGEHIVEWSSAQDVIAIRHTARNRDGFAQGAIRAAEFIAGKKGVFTMADVLQL